MLGTAFALETDDCSLQKKKKMPWCTDNIDFTALNMKGVSSESVAKLTLETLKGAGLIACVNGA